MGVTMRTMTTVTGRSGKPERPSFFPIRAHLLTTSSSLAPYPSPRRRAAGLAHSAAPPLPTKQALRGPLLSAVVALPLVGPCALRGGSRSLRRAPDNAAEPAGFCRHCLCGWQTAVASFASLLQIVVPIRDNLPPACENLPPAALSQRWTMLSRTVHFLLYAPKETKTPPCGGRKDVIHYGDLSSGS
jgi:hypothetical protein